MVYGEFVLMDLNELFRPKTGGRRIHVSLVHPSTLTSADAYGLDVVPPLGLAYIIAAVKSAGHTVTVVDAIGEALQTYRTAAGFPGLLVHGLGIDEIVARIDPGADIVGISNMFSNQWLFIRELIQGIKKAHPEKMIVLGGEHPTACAEYILETVPAVDVCVLGEGEATIVELADAFALGRDFKEVAGIFHRENGKPQKTAKRARLTDIDQIPEPDWASLPTDSYIDNAITYGVNVGRAMPILASRGCPFECTFCSNPLMWSPRWIARKPELLVAEMKKYILRYNVTNFDFYDLTAIVKKSWIVEFAQLLIKEKLNVRYQLASGTRSEAIDEEVVALLRDSGCRLVIYAPESGSPEELRRIKKRVNIENLLISMRAAHVAGMETKANMIFGMLGATWKDVFISLVFIARAALAGLDNVTSYPFSPYPGSENFESLRAEGRITLNDDYFRSLLNLCRNLHTKNTISYNPRFSGSVLSLICSTAFVLFYSLNFLFRPWRILQILNTYFVRNEASSLLTVAFSNVRRKKAVLRLIKSGKVESAEVPDNYLRVRNKAAYAGRAERVSVVREQQESVGIQTRLQE